jgi:hypothetical protein
MTARWEREMSEPLPERIVCAANHYDGIIVLGLRHNDTFMQAGVENTLRNLKLTRAGWNEKLAEEYRKNFYHPLSQGFITNRRRWVTREQAFEIASAQEQIVRKTGYEGNKTLYSEDVY